MGYWHIVVGEYKLYPPSLAAMLRICVVFAAVGAAAAGVCSPAGRRVKADENASYVYPGSSDTLQQAAGVNVKEFMPSEGNLYSNPVDGSNAMYCYAGSPIGYINADMCCDYSQDTCAAHGFLIPNGNSLMSAIGNVENLKGDVVVPVRAQNCLTPTMRKGARSLQRSAAELVRPKPPAVPFEYTSNGQSACDCRNDRLKLNVYKESIVSGNASHWQKHLQTKLRHQTAQPNFDQSSAGTCLFYRAGWAFENEIGTVPLIPTKNLNANGTHRLRVDVTDAEIPLTNDGGVNLPCGKQFSSDDDINYCFLDIPDDLTPRYVSQRHANQLSKFCEDNEGDGFKLMRCCMKVTFGSLKPIYAIKADVLAAAACRNVNEATNNGDGKMHTMFEMEGPLSTPSLEQKHNMGYSEIPVGLIYPDETTAQFRKDNNENGYHEVCTLEEDAGAQCDGYTANTPNRAPPDQTTPDDLARIENTCIIPSTTIGGTPPGFMPEYAASLYNMHARDIDASYSCKDPDAIAVLIQATGDDGDKCKKLKTWSQMKPSTYYSAAGIPLPTAQWLSKSNECAYTSVAAERNPDNRPDDIFGLKLECKQKGILGDSPYETVSPAAGATDDQEIWRTIATNCGQTDQGCKFTPQYSYQSTTYSSAGASFDVLSSKVGCLAKAQAATDPSVGETDESIVFLSAAPRVQGTVHPIYDAGGYIGGSFSNPGFRYDPGTPSFDGTDQELWVTTPDGSGALTLDTLPQLPGEVTSLTGALVIDDHCRIHNYRGARDNPKSVSIAGEYPRFMDVGRPNQQPHYDKCYDGSNTGAQIQMVGSQSFFDLYGRGGGENTNPYVSNNNVGWSNQFTTNEKNNPYEMFRINVPNLAPSQSICGAFSIDMCLDICNMAKHKQEEGFGITKVVLGSLLTIGSGGLLGTVVGGAVAGSGANQLSSIANAADGSATVYPFGIDQIWPMFTRATFEITNPVAKFEARFVRHAYEAYPSNIAEKSATAATSGGWKDSARAFPAQPFAAQLGCHTAENGGDFKQFIPNLDLVAHREVFTTTDEKSDEQVVFGTLGKKDLPGVLQDSHYYLHKDGLPYAPRREDKWLKCGLCGLYTTIPDNTEEYGYVTPRIDDCKIGNKYMRYGLNEAQNLIDTNIASYWRWANHTNNQNTIELQFGYLEPSGGKILLFDVDAPNTDDSIMVQRLLGRNFTHPNSVLTHPLCTGDASSELGVCAMNATLHLQWEHAIVCRDDTKSFSAACINPVWANDHKITLPSSPNYEPTAERLSYCAAPDPDFKDEDEYTGIHSMYHTVNSGRDPTFVMCDNDRFNEEERRVFCMGSQASIPGRMSVMGIRLRARKSIEDVCYIPDLAAKPNDVGRCILFPDDPELWTLAKLSEALQGQPQATYVVNLVPISFTFLERMSYWTTAVETTWFNDPIPKSQPTTLKNAYSDANINVSLMAQYNRIDWSASAQIAPEMCQSGGPSAVGEAKAFGLLWYLVESLRLPNNNFSIAALDGDLAKGESQTKVFRESEVYSGFPDINARIGTRGLILRSAFGEAARARAEELAPAKMKVRFSKVMKAKFDGIPADSITQTCTRVYSEGQVCPARVRRRGRAHPPVNPLPSGSNVRHPVCPRRRRLPESVVGGQDAGRNFRRRRPEFQAG